MSSALARGSLPWRVAPFAWMLLVFLLSSQGDLGDPFEFPSWLPVDKAGHAGLFGVLGALLYMSGLTAPAAIAAAAAYGVIDEVHQMFVPGRSPEILDWIADLLGATAGVYLVRFPSQRAEAHREPVE